MSFVGLCPESLAFADFVVKEFDRCSCVAVDGFRFPYMCQSSKPLAD